MFHSYYIIVIIIFIITIIIWKTNNQMKADVKLNKLAELQLHMLNVRQTTALTVRHYANVILWLKFLPMWLKGLTLDNLSMSNQGHITFKRLYLLKGASYEILYEMPT